MKSKPKKRHTLKPKQILDYFFYRKDVFAEQKPTGIYYPIKRPITEYDIQAHIDGKKTIGAYCLNTNNKIKWGCVDIDGDKTLLPEQNEKNLYPLGYVIYNAFPEYERMLEFSGNKGYHIWIFFPKPVYAGFGQKIIKTRLNMLAIFGHEIFPKQTELNENRKYGNLVKIPQALHKVSGRRSYIAKWDMPKKK